MQLHLFSSNARTLYLQDAINALAQPAGSVVHLRYEDRYVAGNVKQQLPPVGISTLIYLADAERKAEPDAIYPLRQGKLARAELYEGVMHFWVTLDAYPAVDCRATYEAARETAVAQLGQDLPSNNIHATLKPQVTFGDTDNYRAFPTIAGAISENFLDANHLAFVRISGVQRIHGQQLVDEYPEEMPAGSELPPFPQYVWRPGETYVLSLSWHTPDRHTLRGADGLPLQLNFEHDEDLLSLSGPHSMLLNGRYDREYLRITIRKPNKTTRTNLTIRVTQQGGELPAHEKPNQGVLGVHYVIPLEIPIDEQRAGQLLLSGDILTTLGTSLLAICALLTRFLPQAAATAPTPAVAPAAPIPPILWIAIAAALLMIAAGIYRKHQGNKLKE